VVSAAPCEPNSSTRWNSVGCIRSRRLHSRFWVMELNVPIACVHMGDCRHRKTAELLAIFPGFSGNFIPNRNKYRSCDQRSLRRSFATELNGDWINLYRYYVCEIAITREDLYRAGNTRLLIKSPFLSRETKLRTSRSKRRRTIAARCKTSALSPLCHRQGILFAWIMEWITNGNLVFPPTWSNSPACAPARPLK